VETGVKNAIFKYGDARRVIGVNSEMDALPGIEHACGCNLVTTWKFSFR